MQNIVEELEKLEGLRKQGAISETEFESLKAKLLAASDAKPSKITLNQWAVMLHLSQFLAFAIPLAGIIAPVLIWQLKKAEFPELEMHGKVVINWLISSFIYILVSAALMALLIGIPMLGAVILMDIAFPIIAAIKANEGTYWDYPMTIRFLK